MYIALHTATHHRATERHLPYGITQHRPSIFKDENFILMMMRMLNYDSLYRQLFSVTCVNHRCLILT